MNEFGSNENLSVRYSLAILMVVNLSLWCSTASSSSNNYIIAQRQASSVVERLERIRFAPSTTFGCLRSYFAGIALISMSEAAQQRRSVLT